MHLGDGDVAAGGEVRQLSSALKLALGEATEVATIALLRLVRVRLHGDQLMVRRATGLCDDGCRLMCVTQGCRLGCRPAPR